MADLVQFKAGELIGYYELLERWKKVESRYEGYTAESLVETAYHKYGIKAYGFAGRDIDHGMVIRLYTIVEPYYNNNGEWLLYDYFYDGSLFFRVEDIHKTESEMLGLEDGWDSSTITLADFRKLASKFPDDDTMPLEGQCLKLTSELEAERENNKKLTERIQELEVELKAVKAERDGLQEENERLSSFADEAGERGLLVMALASKNDALEAKLDNVTVERDRLDAELKNARQEAARRPETASPGAAGSSAAAENSARRWREDIAPAIMAAAVELSPPPDGLQKVDIGNWLEAHGVSGRGTDTVVNVVWKFLKG